ncbi:MAG: hypothetical protein EOL92_07050 [Bacteroidia bacterium]|nr:hypothetical protein [Bacteroidia bacterium]
MKTIIAGMDFKYKGNDIPKGHYFDVDTMGCFPNEMATLIINGYLTWGEPKNVIKGDSSPKRKYTPRAKKKG